MDINIRMQECFDHISYVPKKLQRNFHITFPTYNNLSNTLLSYGDWVMVFWNTITEGTLQKTNLHNRSNSNCREVLP